MGLDVGAVRFDYSHTPKAASRKFAWYLARNYYEADWGLAEGENMIAEYTLESLLGFAETYAVAEGLADEARTEIEAWIRRLPWRDGHVALHFSW